MLGEYDNKLSWGFFGGGETPCGMRWGNLDCTVVWGGWGLLIKPRMTVESRSKISLCC